MTITLYAFCTIAHTINASLWFYLWRRDFGQSAFWISALFAICAVLYLTLWVAS